MPETKKLQKQAPRIKERNHRGASERFLYLICSLDVSRRMNGFLYASTTLETFIHKTLSLSFSIYIYIYIYSSFRFNVYHTIYIYGHHIPVRQRDPRPPCIWLPALLTLIFNLCVVVVVVVVVVNGGGGGGDVVVAW